MPRLDPTAITTNPDQVLEDYMASLSTQPMDSSRPYWEFHLLDFATSEAASTMVMSLLTLLMASSRSAADPTKLPIMPPPPARTGAIYARPRPPLSAGAPAFVAWAWSYFVLPWHTVVDVAFLVATVLYLKDPQTLFKSPNHGRYRRKRFVHRTLSLDDVKFIKNAMNYTVNDVLVGLTSAALSQYYFRRSCGSKTRKICLRSFLPVNVRPTASLQDLIIHYQSYNRGVKVILAVYEAQYPDSEQLLDDFTESLSCMKEAASRIMRKSIKNS